MENIGTSVHKLGKLHAAPLGYQAPLTDFEKEVSPHNQ